MSSVISSTTKISLCGYFEGSNWPLNKALPRGAEFLCGPLGDIVRQYCLKKMQVACQLPNYKRGKFMNTQVSIPLNQSDLDKRIREGMAMSAPKFVFLTQLRICDPDPSSYGLDFSNPCVVMNSFPSTACTYVRLLASSPDDACFCLLVGVVENWIQIQDIAARFPKTAHFSILLFSRHGLMQYVTTKSHLLSLVLPRHQPLQQTIGLCVSRLRLLKQLTRERQRG
jgi:hypothetical protein